MCGGEYTGVAGGIDFGRFISGREDQNPHVSQNAARHGAPGMHGALAAQPLSVLWLAEGL